MEWTDVTLQIFKHKKAEIAVDKRTITEVSYIERMAINTGTHIYTAVGGETAGETSNKDGGWAHEANFLSLKFHVYPYKC